MSNDPDDIAGELLRWMEVPRQPNVFALGNFARQVTFASQQARAFNLIWALFRTSRLAENDKVAVIGAGLGGLTAAVAALAKGCHVDIFEHASQPCPLQRGNDIRFVHPNILRWPEDGSDKASTDFPYLNWTAATVRGVIKQIDLQWNLRASKNNRLLRKFFNYRVNRLYVSPSKSGPQKPWLSANRVLDGLAVGDETSDGTTPGYVEFAYDAVVLAVGFGEERSVTGVPFLSYWENDSLHQETGRGQRSVLVSGVGDGGLIDALRLRLQNFDHAAFVREFLNIAESSTLVAGLRQVETDLRPQASSPDISLQLQARYDLITVPSKVEAYFRRRKRNDTTVTLNSPAAGPLSFKASLLNRYATYLAMRYADLHYLSGRVVAERSDSGGFRIALERDDIGTREDGPFDLVIVRHGPQNVIGRLIPDNAISEMQSWWDSKEDITIKQHWQLEDTPEKAHQFFRGFDPEIVPTPKDVLDLALATFDTAYREFRRDPQVQSVAVGEHEGKASFIVTLKSGSPERRPNYYAGWVLVQYVIPTVAHPSAVPEATVGRRLPVGIGIYNYDAQQRFTRTTPNDGTTSSSDSSAETSTEPYPSSAGTLTCFATDKSGKDTYLLTTSFAFGLDAEERVGDSVFIEGESPATNNPVARITGISWLPTVEGDRQQTVAIASARLEPDVTPDYGALKNVGGIKTIGKAKLGDKVAKIGRTSGLALGTVSEVDVITPVWGIERMVHLQDCFVIKGEDASSFSLAGDTGAGIVRDGTLVGIEIGYQWDSGRIQSAIAAPLQHALKELDLVLLPSEKTEPKPPAIKRRKFRGKGSKKAKS